MQIHTGQEAADGQCGQPQQSWHTDSYPPDSMEKALVVIYALITNPVSITIRCTGPSGE
jgi:xylose isomerase